MSKRIFALLLLLLPALLLLFGCSAPEEQAQESAYKTIRAAEINPGDAVPAPQGDVILTITGKIGNKNVGDSLQFDMETLEKLGLIEYSVDDRQAEGRVVGFQGVLMSQLLDVAQIDPQAATLFTIALNDYVVEIPTSDIREYPVMLATSVDGERMPVERYGPTRVVYPTSSYEFDPTVYDARWIWQLASIDVR